MESAANKVEANNTGDRTVRKSGKEDKGRRKDDKSVDQILKSLNNMETAEEKLSAICKKYADVVDENRKLQLVAKQWEKGVASLQREKEQIQTDHSKAVLTRSRLESLCRELQRQNKAVKEESLLKVREEEEKRKEVSAKFNATLGEITTLMSSSNEKTNKLRDENVDITKKFRSICEQSGLQQQQVDKMNMQRKLEAELNEAKMTKQKLEFSAEKEILLREKQQLLMDLQEARTRANDLVTNEMNLKTQVALYADRYEEFQNALSRSNDVFGGFKGEMDKMSKKIVKLEKETLSWKSRWEKSHQALLEMATDKQQRDGELSLVSRQLTQLQKLCRTLQTERVNLLAQIKGSEKTTDGTESIQAALPEIEPEDVPIQSLKEIESTLFKDDKATTSPKSVVDVKGSKAAQLKSNKKAKLTAELKLKEALKANTTPAVGVLSDRGKDDTGLIECNHRADNTSETTGGEELKVNQIDTVTETHLLLTEATQPAKSIETVDLALGSVMAPILVAACAQIEEVTTGIATSPIKSTKEDLNAATQKKNRNEPELKHKKPQKSKGIPTTKSELSTFNTENVTAVETASAELPKENEESTEILSITLEDVSLGKPCVSNAMLPSPGNVEPIHVGPDPVPAPPAPIDAHQEPAQVIAPEAPSLALPNEVPTEVPALIPAQPPATVPDSEPDKVVSLEVKKGKEGAKKRKK